MTAKYHRAQAKVDDRAAQQKADAAHAAAAAADQKKAADAAAKKAADNAAAAAKKAADDAAAAATKAQPAPAPEPPPSTQAPQALMPNVPCGTDLQVAQNTVQTAGVFFSRSEDASGQGRSQLIDSNWTVVGQRPAAGVPISEGDPVFLVVKDTEFAGC